MPVLLSKFNVHSYIYKQKIADRPGDYWRIAITGTKNVSRFFSISPKTKPNIEEKISEILSQKEGRDDLFSNVPPGVLFNNFPVKITANNRTVYMQLHRGQRTERNRLKTFAEENGISSNNLLNNQLSYLKCNSVEVADSPNFVYCLQTSEGNFFTGNGVLVKNCNSLLNHRADWLSQIGLLVIDEVHTLGSDRGPALEMLITKLRFLNKGMQLLGLSATIPNAQELAAWLNAELVESDYRPVHLKEGIFLDGELDFGSEKQGIEKVYDEVYSIAQDTLKRGKQALVFANTRKTSESSAKTLAPLAEKHLSDSDKRALEKASEQVLNVLEQPTVQCKTIASLIKSGSCFHNAGLLHKQRLIIEELFKKNHLKFICSTPTLAAGVNLPAFRVIIKSPYRYSGFGMERIPVSEYKQMSGRAGRPKYDSEGQAILIAKTEMEKDDYFDYFVKGQIESIDSRLGAEHQLRFHILSLIATGFIFDLDSADRFFSKTFYAHQSSDLGGLLGKVTSSIAKLEEMGFVESTERRIDATPLGRRVAELYLDPVSAFKLIDSLRAMKFDAFAYIFSVVNTTEFQPLLSVPRAKNAELWERLQEEKSLLPINVDAEMFTDNELLEKYWVSLMLREWISEVREQEIMDSFKVQPGILRYKLDNADWLAYSALELSKILGFEQHFAPLNILRKRLKAGIKEELVPLCELRGIGRVRARRLFNAGVKSVAHVKKTDVKDLGKILSPKVAVSVKAQLSMKK